MENMIIWQIVGFVVCFVLLFVFIAKYREVVANEEFFEQVQDVPDTSGAAVAANTNAGFESRASLLKGGVPEVADVKEQVRSLHYQLAELKTATNKTQVDTAKQLARLEQRLSTFEQEYVNKLQPTLLRVIEELEHIKGTEETESND